MKDNDFSTVQLIIRDVAEHEPDHNPDALHISVKALELVLTKHIEPLRDRKNSIVDLQQRLTAAESDCISGGQMLLRKMVECNQLTLRESQLRRALGGMLFGFDDGVGREWSADLLDYARTLTPAVEFTADKPRPIRFADLPEPDWRDPAGRIVFLESENKSLRGNCKAMGKQLRKRGSLRIEAGKKRKDAEMAQLRENMQGWFLLAQDRALQVIELEALLREAHSYVNDVAHDPDVWLKIDAVLNRKGD